MRCLKCKKEIADNLLRCNFCNTKVQTVCPVCGTMNPITSEFCAGCGLQLLKYCPQCHSVNLPDAKICRKCHTEFEIEQGSVTIVDLKQIQESAQEKEIEEGQLYETQKFVTEPDIAKNTNDIDIPDSLPILTENDDNFTVEKLSDYELINIEENANLDDINREEPEPNEELANDLLSIADDIDIISQSLEKENLTPDPVINKDALKAEVAEEPLSEEEFVEKKPVEEPKQEDQDSAISETKQDVTENTINTEANDKNTDVKISAEEIPEPVDLKDLAAEEINAFDQMKCKNKIVDALRNPHKLIVGLSAPEGSGKSTVLKYLFGDLMHQNYAWFWGECSANSQISPYGIFQEMILTFFNMPNFSNMSDDFLKQAKQMLSATLPGFTQEEILLLFNFLYPTLTAHFEDILINKDRTFALLEKLILEIAQKAKLIIVIDDFDMIDGASYAFLSEFIEKGNLGENIKLIVTYKDNRLTQGYFYSEKLAQNQYEDLRLTPLNLKDADNLIKLYLNGYNPLPEPVFEIIYEYSNGNCAYLEQMLVLFNENKAFGNESNKIKYRQTSIEANLPKNLHDILALRLNYLQQKFPLCFRTLCTAAIMGNKFNVKLLEIIMKLKPDEFQNVLQLLTDFAYITQFNNNIYEFKNTLIWKFVYEKAKTSKDFVLLNEKIFDIINMFTLSSNALKALVAQSLNQKLLALNIWTDNIKLCSYLGDEYLWTLSQKQCLRIVQEINPENNDIIVNNIYERLGKLLYISRPTEAISYLSVAINNAIKVSNRPKIIELSGYLSKSCSLTGNYNGVIEAVDTVLALIENQENKLECALIKHKKLKAMFCIGNAEEIYNLASSEIIPVVEQALSGLIPNNNISMDIIYETWLECNLTVAMSLISQGNNKCFAILKVIDEIVAKNNVTNKNYLHRVQLAKALANSVLGNIKKSDDILITFSQETTKEILEPDVISMWNFINILNKIYKQDWANIKEDMYSVATFANNYNDVLVKNMLKVFLGKVLQEEGNLSKALEIFNEQVTIFAKEKIAIGAMLCWYYIAKLTLVTDGSDKALDIALKALDVAKNPKISNYYFMVLYKKLIAEIFLIKGDMESAKMYIEKGLMIVKQYDMKLLRISLYQLYAKYLEEMVSKKPQNKANYAHNAIEAYKKALAMTNDMDIPNIQADINKNLASFKAFCQLNQIKF